MQLKNAPNDLQSMAQDGDAILRSLQNKSLPIVDLMIRESLQNSLDATLPNTENTIVDFNVGKFNSYELSSHLEGIENELNERYEMFEDFISIGDKNTTGLTGNYSSTDANELNKSNFYKLVFGIGKNQEADGAGGSWGLGKTSYFRIGAGIVIYYTRVKNGNDFEERLVASLIESPKEQSRLLPDNVRGIAWWGKYAEDANDDRIFPLTDKDEIYNILKIFNLTNYKDEETGTTIIIPFIKGTQNNIENENIYPWEENKELAIKYAIQRWYNPRLNNQEYNKMLGNSKLITQVNEDPLIDEYNIEPFFKIMKDLYTSALTTKPLEKNINVKPIFLKRNGMKNPSDVPVGHVAFKEFTKEELEMVAPNNRFSPLQLLGYKNDKKIEENNSKIIAYCRKPGMIVEYSVDGEWVPKANLLNKNNLLIGFFVPNSNGELTTKFENEGYKNLEQYLRATENADHADWIDEDGFGIIQRMKSTTSKVINDFYQGEDSERQSSATSGISRKFGKIFLPPKNYGRTSTSKKEKSTRTIKSENKNRMADISVLNSEPIDESNVRVEFKSNIKNGAISAVYLEVLSQEKKMNKKEWEKAMGSSIEFPFIISEIMIKKINNQDYYKDSNQINAPDISIYQLEENLDEFIIENKSGELIEVEGEMNIKTNTFNFIPNIAISSEKYKRKWGCLKLILSTNQIALYRKLNNEFIEKANVRFEQLKLSYISVDDLEEKEIEINEESLVSYNINEFDSMWSPYENNLKLEQKLIIEYPMVLFGKDGITCESNKIGLAVHIYSKTSNFQETVKVASFEKQESRLELNFNYNFEPSTIRGIVNLDFFLYLEEVNDTLPYMANHKGMTLSYEDLNPIELVVDGAGSSFPITEFEEKDGPLWKIEKNWTSPEDDTLDAANISIAFNIKHPLFSEIKKETRRINSSYMNHIIIQAMAMIIQQVIIIEECSVEDEENLIPGTILSAVSYWVKTFNVDTSDIFTIQNSLMKNTGNAGEESSETNG